MGVRRPGQLGRRVLHAGLLYSCRWQPADERLAQLRDTAVCESNTDTYPYDTDAYANAYDADANTYAGDTDAYAFGHADSYTQGDPEAAPDSAPAADASLTVKRVKKLERSKAGTREATREFLAFWGNNLGTGRRRTVFSASSMQSAVSKIAK